MNVYISTKEELQETVANAVEEAITKRLPHIIKKATSKDYYTIDDVCKMLDVSRRHLQYLRDSGQISYVKNGRKIYFKAEDLEKFFDSNYIQSTEEV